MHQPNHCGLDPTGRARLGDLVRVTLAQGIVSQKGKGTILSNLCDALNHVGMFVKTRKHHSDSVAASPDAQS